jgi:hypothetical protein
MIEQSITKTRTKKARAKTASAPEPQQSAYQAFLARKAQLGNASGFVPVWMPDFLFDFQAHLTEWAIRQGRAALYEDCGLGKTIQQLVYAENVVRHTNKRVLLLTPLAVSNQTASEAEKFGIEAHVSRDGQPKPGITITNYERLHHFDSNDYISAVCDESSIFKNFNGVTKARATEFMRRMPYRLLCTATAAPNDYTELGTSSEALGGLGYTDMLNRFFKNDQNNSGTGRVYGQGRHWRFKGHAEVPFWRWLSSWARALRRPSDFGFSDERFTLPPLVEQSHVISARKLAPGFLFEMTPKGMQEEREEQRRTIRERCEKAAELAHHKEPCVIWCNLNDEGDLLETLLKRDFVQIKGKQTERDMMEREEMFAAFGKKQIRGLIIKPKIGALGMNWQHCAHTISFPTYSYEQYYQLVRRFWRFGQTQSVRSDLVTTESGCHIRESLQRKSRQADEMFSALVRHMHEALTITTTNPTQQEQRPQWL